MQSAAKLRAWEPGGKEAYLRAYCVANIVHLNLCLLYAHAIYTQLCICYVRHYASECMYLCMFICMYVHVCMSAQGQ